MNKRLLAFILLLQSASLSAQFKQATLQTTPLLPTVRVEAGVNVYQHDATAFTRAPQLELVGAPVTRIDGSTLDPVFDLTRADDVVLLSDGRIATFSSVGSRFLLFRANGQAERRIGRHGQGPGEFFNVSGMALLAGDTMFLYDEVNRRLNWVTADKGVVLNKPTGTARLLAHKAVGLLPNGDILMTSQGLLQDGVRDKVVRPLANVALMSRTGSIRPLAGVPDWEVVMVTMHAPKITYWERTPLRLGRHAAIAAWDSNIVTGIGEGYRIDVRNALDKPVSRIVVNTPRRKVTNALRDFSLKERLSRVRPAKSSEEIGGEYEKQFIRETPVADSLPPYQQLFVTPNKTLWVLDYIAPGDSGWSATAFRRDGAIVGRLRVPFSGRPETFGDDRVVIRTEDEDGVVSFVVRRIGITTAKPK